MSSGGGGGVVEGRGGFRGVGFGGETGGGFRGGVADGVSGGVKDNSGLFANRPRGFGLETPSLRDMKAKQGAIVSKFMTFFQRKYSLVVEMYQSSFYRQKPNWDRIAEFVYSDLCTTEDLRKEVKDVQFHPVKMLLFVKFSEEMWRDVVVEKLQSTEGVTWTEYGVRVKGYSLDAEVKFIRLLGVSPETGEEEIKETFLELGIGEVIELKKGWLDAKRLPGVTNGTWALRVKILDPDKIIPSYIHRRDEGELWSLNFEGRIFCCWKCGSGYHIGDKCREHSRTFDEVFNGSASDEHFEKPTWAAVVRSGQGDSEQSREKVREMEMKIKEDNKRRDKERKEVEENERFEKEEVERKKNLYKAEKQFAVQKAMIDAQEATVHVNYLSEEVEGDGDDALFSNVVGIIEDEVKSKSCSKYQEIVTSAESNAREKALQTAIKHKTWLEQRSTEKLTTSMNIELERIFGPGAGQLAIEFQVSNHEDDNEASEHNEDADGNEPSDTSGDELDPSLGRMSSTPTRQAARRGRKRMTRNSDDSTASLSPVREPLSDSEEGKNKDKKFKLALDEDSQDGDVMGEGSGNLRGEDGGNTLDELDLQVGENNVDNLVDQQRNMLEPSVIGSQGGLGNRSELERVEWHSICEFWEHEDTLQSSSNGDDLSSEVALPSKSPDRKGGSERN